MMRTLAPILLLLFALVGRGAAAQGAGPTISASLTPREATTADLLTLTLTFEHESLSARPDWDTLGLTLPDGWQVVRERIVPDRTLADGRMVSEHTLTLEPFLPGEFVVGPATLPLDGDRGPLVAEPIPVVIRSVLPEDGEVGVADRKTVVEPTWPINWLVIGLGVGAVAMVGGLAFLSIALIVTRSRGEQRTVRTPHELALRRLEELAARDLISSGLVKEHFAEVSGIVRRYIEDRFALRAPEQTTREFLSGAARSRLLGPEDVGELERFLTQCDLVKFAGFRPGEGESKELADSARGFIERTRSDGVQIVFDRAGRRVGRRLIDDQAGEGRGGGA